MRRTRWPALAPSDERMCCHTPGISLVVDGQVPWVGSAQRALDDRPAVTEDLSARLRSEKVASAGNLLKSTTALRPLLAARELTGQIITRCGASTRWGG